MQNFDVIQSDVMLHSQPLYYIKQELLYMYLECNFIVLSIIKVW